MSLEWTKLLLELPVEVVGILAELADQGWPIYANPPDYLTHVNPFRRDKWSGKIESVDDTRTSHVPQSSHVFTLVAGQTDVDWDGKCAGIAYIADGRWIAWETWWDTTGTGFEKDAYGGADTIYVGSHPETLRNKALGAEGRFICDISYPSDTQEFTSEQEVE